MPQGGCAAGSTRGNELPDTITAPPDHENTPYFQCEDDDHSGCPHVQFTTAIQVLPAGVRMVYPGQPELDFTLCQCACHADCSLAGEGEGAGWPDGCSCNETLKMRDRARRMPPSDGGINLSDTLGGGFDQARRQRSARQAAAARAKDRNPEEIGAIIDEEWSRHGLDGPTGMTRKSEISRITNPPNAIEQAVTTAKFFKDLIGAPLRFRDRVRTATAPEPTDEEEQANNERTYEVATGQDRVEVPIDERTRSQLGKVADEGILAPSLARLFTVEIRGGQDDNLA
jgi:hypothetical protein